MNRVVLIGCLAALALSARGQSYRIFIHPSSLVTVFGSTNVNQFRFKYTEQLEIKKAVNVSRENRELRLKGGDIPLKIKAFDSGNSIMNSDFRKMMKEDENPYIQVELAALIPEWDERGSWTKGKAEVMVEMNQVVKKFVFDCLIEDPGSLLIQGKQKILLQDFGLEPPTRLMGMIKVNEWVDLDFKLRFATDH
jgi:hypothetical protein